MKLSTSFICIGSFGTAIGALCMPVGWFLKLLGFDSMVEAFVLTGLLEIGIGIGLFIGMGLLLKLTGD